MKDGDKTKNTATSWETWLKIIPVLVQNYPNLAGLISQLTGVPAENTATLQEMFPKVMQTLKEMDQETREDILDQLTKNLPELEELFIQMDLQKKR